jgi:hypothetical protein
MKKITLALFGLFLFSLLATSCKKDDAEPQFGLTDLIGAWERIGGTDFIDCSTGDNEQVEITSGNITIEFADENDGCKAVLTFSLDDSYEFESGNTFQTEGFSFKVTSLNDDIMKGSLYVFGSTYNYELQKLQ